MTRIGAPIKKILLWIVTAFFTIAAIAFLPRFSGFAAVVLVIILVPIDQWQSLIRPIIKGKVKVIAAVVLAVVCIFTAPTSKAPDTEEAVFTPIVNDIADTETNTRTMPVTNSDSEDSTITEENSKSTEELTPAQDPESAQKPTADPVTELAEEPDNKTTDDPQKETTSETDTGTVIAPVEETPTEPDKEPATEKTQSDAGSTTEPSKETNTEPTEPAKPSSGQTEEQTKPSSGSTENKEYDYILNKNSGIFHYPNCGSVKKMKDSNKVYFQGTREEAIAKGYEPCKNCHP